MLFCCKHSATHNSRTGPRLWIQMEIFIFSSNKLKGCVWAWHTFPYGNEVRFDVSSLATTKTLPVDVKVGSQYDDTLPFRFIS